MDSLLLGMLAETSIHPGAGRGLGVVDLPVAREKAGGYPVIVGSSLKGSLREAMEQRDGVNSESVISVFGRREGAGDVLVSDARLLLLPVRGLATAAHFVTCPQLIERFIRDRRRGGLSAELSPPQVLPGQALTSGGDPHLFLEERLFDVAGGPPSGLADAIAPLARHEETQRRLRERLVILHDCDFAWFTEFGLPVQARNVLDNTTKISSNLWYEETLPPDTLMYALLSSSRPTQLAATRDLLVASGYLQVGGNATVGQGWFAVAPVEEGSR